MPWTDFDKPDQFEEALAKVGHQRRALKEAESHLKAQAEPVIVRAIQLGVPLEKAAELTGYSLSVLTKWERSAAARRAHEIKQQQRDETRARARALRKEAKARAHRKRKKPKSRRNRSTRQGKRK